MNDSYYQPPPVLQGLYGTAVDPVFDARENIRQACKHLIQAEIHLREPDRRCPDCVEKHLLAAEGYADEVDSLDRAGRWRAEAHMIGVATRGALLALAGGATPGQVAAQLRPTRKACLSATRSFQLDRGTHIREAITDTVDAIRNTITPKNAAIAAGLGALWWWRNK